MLASLLLRVWRRLLILSERISGGRKEKGKEKRGTSKTEAFFTVFAELGDRAHPSLFISLDAHPEWLLLFLTRERQCFNIAIWKRGKRKNRLVQKTVPLEQLGTQAAFDSNSERSMAGGVVSGRV